MTTLSQLASALADSPLVHECYVQHWLEYAHGRPSLENDGKLVEELGAASHTGGLGLRDMLIGIVASEGFLNRSTEELP